MINELEQEYNDFMFSESFDLLEERVRSVYGDHSETVINSCMDNVKQFFNVRQPENNTFKVGLNSYLKEYFYDMEAVESLLNEVQSSDFPQYLKIMFSNEFKFNYKLNSSKSTIDFRLSKFDEEHTPDTDESFIDLVKRTTTLSDFFGDIARSMHSAHKKHDFNCDIIGKEKHGYISTEIELPEKFNHSNVKLIKKIVSSHLISNATKSAFLAIIPKEKVEKFLKEIERIPRVKKHYEENKLRQTTATSVLLHIKSYLFWATDKKLIEEIYFERKTLFPINKERLFLRARDWLIKINIFSFVEDMSDKQFTLFIQNHLNKNI